MMDGYWDVVEKKGLERNPYRAGFLQLVAVSETDAQAEADYAKHVEYFYHKCLHVPPQWFAPPGNQDYRSLLAANRNPVRRAEDPKTLRYRDFVDKGYVIAGSPATVRERLIEEVVKRLHVGNLMVLVQIGSMPHELTLKNIDLFAREVLPGAARDLGRRGLGEPLVAREMRSAAAGGQPAGRGASDGGARDGEATRTVTVWNGPRAPAGPRRGRRGPRVVFFHGPWGLTWGPFLDALARQFTVYAPEHPGHEPGEPGRDRGTSTPCGIWCSATTSCSSSSGCARSCSSGTPSGPWWPARWPPCSPRACSGWSSSIPSGSGATTRR